MSRLRRAFGAALALVAAACGDAGTTGAGTITVSAAASLTDAFGRIGAAFEQENPAATVTFNFGSSATLATQIQQGAPADVFASADEATMDELERAGLLEGGPARFARNRLVIVTKPGNPDRVEDLAGLAEAGIVSLCGSEVPCGRYADEILRRAGVVIPETRVTRGADVKATLGAVARGDADAGIVYVTDARAAGDTVEAVAIPDAQNVIATYPVAALGSGRNREIALAFVDYVTSPRGQRILRSFGFLPTS